MALPQFSPEQRKLALEKAAMARKIRADLKSDLKAGRKTFADVVKLAKKDNVIGKTKVISLIKAIPGIGTVKANEIMAEAKVHENRRLTGLGSKQEVALIEILS